MDRFLKDGKRIDGVWNDLMKKSHIDKKLMEKEIISRWEELAGSLVARHTKSLNYYKDKLTIQLDSAPLKNEISMRKASLISKINAGLKAEVIKDIVIR